MSQNLSETLTNIPLMEVIPNTDWFLEMLVEMVNGKDSCVGITLSVGGSIISGKLISGHKYFEEFAADFCKQIPNCTAESLTGFASLGDSYKSENTGESMPLRYIHLKDAKIFQSGETTIPSSGILWRGKLDSIDGFFLGYLSIDKK
jgi:hypothetical protein